MFAGEAESNDVDGSAAWHRLEHRCDIVADVLVGVMKHLIEGVSGLAAFRCDSPLGASCAGGGRHTYACVECRCDEHARARP